MPNPTKSRAEAEWVRRALAGRPNKEISEILGMNHAGVSRFMAGKSQIGDEAVESLYEKEIIARPQAEQLSAIESELETPAPQAIPIDEIKEHPLNEQIYGDCADDELIESIRKNGVLTPLLVSRDYLLLSGHRRLDAARKAGLEEVPVVFSEAASSVQDEILIEANLQRQKNNEQIGREFILMEEIESQKAAERRRNGANGEIVIGAARDLAAKKLGIGPQKAAQLKRVVEVLDQYKEWKKRYPNSKEDENKLREILNSQSANAACAYLDSLNKIDRAGGDAEKSAIVPLDQSEAARDARRKEHEKERKALREEKERAERDQDDIVPNPIVPDPEEENTEIAALYLRVVGLADWQICPLPGSDGKISFRRLRNGIWTQGRMAIPRGWAEGFELNVGELAEILKKEK